MSFTATDPRTGAPLPPGHAEATAADVAAAVSAAAEAAPWLRSASPGELAGLLRAVAGELEADADQLLAVADVETALGQPRLQGELARTTFQLRSFAALVADGRHLDCIIDTADPDAAPVPRPDLRRMLVPLGPVAVFGAVNFPLAFGVCGGDTASALAAGCPVVVKGHPSHPATSERCAAAVQRALLASGAPPGTLTLVQGAGHAVGAALVTAPAIRAVGFTGSLRGGRALCDLAAARPDPIPVHAEMGSLNPLFVTAAALASRPADIATGLAGSMTLGTGQFCTKPGLVVVPDTDTAATDRFLAALVDAVAEQPVGWMLDARLAAGLRAGLDRTLTHRGVDRLTPVPPEPQAGGYAQPATVLSTSLAELVASPELTDEHFGPVTLVVRCSQEADLVVAARHLGGTLTATIHAEPDDSDIAAALAAALVERCGRLVWNGYPTGVAVTAAMQHGGPWPASSSIHTSVGTTAVRRFQRPVAYQSTPDAVLPAALRDANPLGVPRQVDGQVTRKPLPATP